MGKNLEGGLAHVCFAGGKDYRQIREFCVQFQNQVHPALSGQNDVYDRQVNNVRIKDFLGILGGGCELHRMILGFQNGLDEFRYRMIVFNY